MNQRALNNMRLQTVADYWVRQVPDRDMARKCAWDQAEREGLQFDRKEINAAIRRAWNRTPDEERDALLTWESPASARPQKSLASSHTRAIHMWDTHFIGRSTGRAEGSTSQCGQTGETPSPAASPGASWWEDPYRGDFDPGKQQQSDRAWPPITAPRCGPSADQFHQPLPMRVREPMIHRFLQPRTGEIWIAKGAVEPAADPDSTPATMDVMRVVEHTPARSRLCVTSRASLTDARVIRPPRRRRNRQLRARRDERS